MAHDVAFSSETFRRVVLEAIAATDLRDVRIAERAGVDPSMISHLKWGRTSVTEDVARRILAACGYRLVITIEPIEAASAA